MTSRIGRTKISPRLLPSFIKKIPASSASGGAGRQTSLSLSVRQAGGRQGFTFIELMSTLAILSFGIVMIYKAFFSSLDQLAYLHHRLYATIFLDDQLAQMQRSYKSTKTMPLNFSPSDSNSMDIGYKTIDFNPTKAINPVADLPQLFQVDVSISWAEKANHSITLSRSAYMGNPEIVSEENK